MITSHFSFSVFAQFTVVLLRSPHICMDVKLLEYKDSQVSVSHVHNCDERCLGRGVPCLSYQCMLGSSPSSPGDPIRNKSVCKMNEYE